MLMQNLALAEAVYRMAAQKGCTPGQLALAWLLHKGDDVIPIPGDFQVGVGQVHANHRVNRFSGLWAYVHPSILLARRGRLRVANVWWPH
jgi:hypothetical protein